MEKNLYNLNLSNIKEYVYNYKLYVLTTPFYILNLFNMKLNWLIILIYKIFTPKLKSLILVRFQFYIKIIIII